MSLKIKKAIKRLEEWLDCQYTRTMSTQYAVFLDDVATLVDYVKRGDKRV